MKVIIIAVWWINLLLSILFSVLVLRKKSKVWLGLFFAALPVVGFLIYFIAMLVLKLSKNHKYDRESLIKRYQIDQMQKEPQVEKELDVIPVEDAMAVGSNQEKRFLLLDQLKQDMHENYKYILPASADEDSESAHYVAAGMMEVYRKKRAALKKLQDAAMSDPEDHKKLHDYLAGLIEYMNSQLISTKEALIYKTEYCQWFRKLEDPAKITNTENTAYVSYLIDLGMKKEASAYWSSCPAELRDEEGFRSMLEMYYDDTEKEKFYSCLNMLKDSEIVLSPEGMKMLRFWEARGN